MACVHTTHVNPGSEKPIAPPTATPAGSGGKLSGSAIAGIVVGVVVGVALIAAVAFWFWHRRKSSRNAKSAEPSSTEDGSPPAYTDGKEQQTPVAEAPTDTGVKELSPNNEVRPELPSRKSGPTAELVADVRPADAKPTWQSGNTGDPAELLAEVPNSATPDGARW